MEKQTQKLSDKQLDSKLNAHRRVSMAGIAVLIGGILLLMADLIAVRSLPLGVAAAAVAVVGAVMMKKGGGNYRKLIGEQLGGFLEENLSSRFGPNTSADTPEMWKGYLQRADLVKEKWERLEGDSLRGGVYDGLPFQIANVKLLHDEAPTAYEEDGKTITVFRGMWFRCDWKRAAKSPVRVYDSRSGIIPADRYKTGDEVFDGRFYVECVDPQDAACVLDLPCMTAINRFTAAADAECRFCFCDGKLDVSVKTEKRFQNMERGATNDVAGIRASFTASLDYAASMLHCLAEGNQ